MSASLHSSEESALYDHCKVDEFAEITQSAVAATGGHLLYMIESNLDRGERERERGERDGVRYIEREETCSNHHNQLSCQASM